MDMKTSIKDLKKQVDVVTNTSKFSFSKKFSQLQNFNFERLNCLKTYIIIPVITSVILLIANPSCIKKEVIDNNGDTKYKHCMVKLLLFTFGISIPTNLGIFGYFYKKKNK